MGTPIEIIEFTDPACTWCWGSEPLLRKLGYHLGSKIKVGYVMGGLVKDTRTFMDPRNSIGGDLTQFNQQVAKHWLEASERHGMPVQTDGFELFTESDDSTHPLNIAYKAAQLQGENIANRFLRRMREAVAAETRQANRAEVLIELANDIGLDIPLFISAMNDGSAEQAFKSDQDIMRKYSIRGFPSYLLKNGEGKEIVMRGYQTYDDLMAALSMLSEDVVAPTHIDVNAETILDFISHYDRIAAIELQEAFNLDRDAADNWLELLTNRGDVSAQKVGNGAFYALAPQSGFCNSEASGIRQLPGILVLGGGVTIQASGSMVGAVGVAGAPDGKADEKCAMAGVEAIQELLEFAD